MSFFNKLFSGKDVRQNIQPSSQNINDADIWNERGEAKIKNNDPQEAIKDFTRAIKLNPNHPLAFSSRGHAYGMIKKFRRAIKDLTKALEQNPNNAAIYYIRGECYILSMNAQQPRAIRDFSKAIELKPDYADAYLSRAKTRGFMGLITKEISDFTNALSDCEMFIQLSPDSPEVPHCRELMEIFKKKITG
jgi:tetratricopeptide (TPR) repeat protein